MTKCLQCALLCVCLLAPLAAAQPSLEVLLAEFAGPDEAARAHARQLLPRQGASAVPGLIPLLEHEDADVRSAASNVLADIANEVCAPRRGEERRAVTRQFMALLSPDRSIEVRIEALRLLPIAVAERNALEPIAQLLADEDLREKARASLEEIATPNAAKALLAAMPQTDAPFQAALLNSLALMMNEESIAAALAYTASEDAAVRAAAVRACAWSGEPRCLEAARRVYDQATPETAFDAADALIRTADAAVRVRNDRPAACEAYRQVLANASDVGSRNAAIVGLTRNGDDGAPEVIVAALEGEHGEELAPAALSALQHGQGVDETLQRIYAAAPVRMRESLLAVMGRRQDPLHLDALRQAAQDDNPDVRRIAYSALADSQLSEAIAVLAAAALERPEERAEAGAALERMAYDAAFYQRGKEAGEASLALYRIAESDEARAAAMAGVLKHPSVEAFDVVMSALDSGAMDNVTIDALGKLALDLSNSGRTEDFDRLMERVFAMAMGPARLKEAILLSRELGGIPDLTQRLGFVTKWLVAGPFPWVAEDGFAVQHVGEPDVDTQAVYRVDGKETAWKPFAIKNDMGIVDLMEAAGGESNCIAYAHATIVVPEALDAEARMGSDDGIKLWVNGEAVHENNADRGTQVDQDRAPIRLEAGENTLLAAVTQGGAAWNFCLRLTHPDGSPLQFEYAKDEQPAGAP